jgi:16S rRNA (guanine527-N7)-methyltransferase
VSSPTARLRTLSERFGLPEGAAGKLEPLLALVISDPAAPTALRTPDEIVDLHIADALVGLELDAVRGAAQIADLGAGAGFPGLVLATALPAAHVSLVESQSRKCAFMERAIGEMGLTNAAVVCTRAESWVAGLEACDLVTARALAPLNVLVEYAAPLLCERGALVAWKGRRDGREETDGAAAAAATGLVLTELRPVRPWDGAENLHLHVYLKVATTPKQFPRRPGIARKRPLRA